ARRAHLEMVLDRQTKLVAERGRRADGDDRAAVVEELLERRQRRLWRHLPEHLLILGGNVRRIRAAAAAAAPTTAGRAARTANLRAGRQDEDVELALEVPRIQVLRIDERIRNLEILEFVPRPARRHRAAVLVVQRDPLRRHWLGVRRTRAHAGE